LSGAWESSVSNAILSRIAVCDPEQTSGRAKTTLPTVADREFDDTSGFQDEAQRRLLPRTLHFFNTVKEIIMNKFNLTALSAAFCLAMSTSAFALNTPHAMSKTDYKAAKDQISTKFKDDKAACKAMTANAKDICMEEAKGREKVAKAELEAKYEPSIKHDKDVRMAKADAAFQVAKEKCDDQSGNAKDVCVQEAKALKTKALANAKMGKEIGEAKVDASQAKRDADYKVAAEKCAGMSGDAKASCMAAAKTKFGKN